MAAGKKDISYFDFRYCLYIVCLWTLISFVGAQEDQDPCDDENAINLPGSKTCLVYVKEAKNWVEASQVCERNGGNLYQLQDGRLRMDDDVQACLGSHPKGVKDMDFWIGAISNWKSQWVWVNGSFLNPLLACAANTTGTSNKEYDICSQSLSVDYCVSNCRSDGAPYCVLQYGRNNVPCCWCSYREPTYQLTCPEKYFRDNPAKTVWVFHTYSREGSGIILDSSESLTSTETLCGVVDEKTTVRRELSSEPCFTKNPYICNFKKRIEQCTFYVNDDCMWIGPDKLNWIEARAECRIRGGDLVVVAKGFVIMDQFKPYIKGSHWIGATNHLWNFTPLSNVFGSEPDYPTVTCGHMYNELDQWDWSDGGCDTRKPFVCQYTPKTEVVTLETFACPWPIGGTVINETGGVQPASVSGGLSAFPLAAIIAASIMALLIITCAILTIGISRRRKRFVENMTKSVRTDGLFAITKAPKRYYHLWNSPYSYPHYSDRKSDIDVDSLSTIHTGVFNDGSVLSVPGYSYDDQGRQIYTLVGDADYLYGKINRRTDSERSNIVHVLSDPIAEEEETEETDVKMMSNMSAVHSTNSHNPKEYMTLAAMMNFGDENILGKSTLRNRPEVALVTSDVDLNFTVNHALPKKRTFSDTTERTIEEIELPRGTTVELPTKLKQEEVDLQY
ncbi:hypothetical protein SNE40_003729 [Patella caerulea]|uniref:C-type lectin domain-containing protein n=1 Tax=Patella caerulea TaxID=87958 RepID=A0AAN8KIU7_PATCE